jgi:hypothetical protein
MFVDILILLLIHSPLSVLRLNSQGTPTSARILDQSPGRMQSAFHKLRGEKQHQVQFSALHWSDMQRKRNAGNDILNT